MFHSSHSKALTVVRLSRTPTERADVNHSEHRGARNADSSPHSSSFKKMMYKRTSSIASRALKACSPPRRLFHASPCRLTTSQPVAGSSKSWSGLAVAGVALGSGILGWAVARRGQKEEIPVNVRVTTEDVKSESSRQGFASLSQMETVRLSTNTPAEPR